MSHLPNIQNSVPLNSKQLFVLVLVVLGVLAGGEGDGGELPGAGVGLGGL